MPASSAVWRRLCAVVPLAVASFAVSSLAVSPHADAAIGQLSNAASSQVSHQATRLPPVRVRINHAANVAIEQIGDPYQYGAAGPNAFDCSGLTMFSYAHARLSLPRTAAGQYAGVRHILKEHLMRGDLVFFHDGGGHVYHAAMFLYWNSRHQAVIIHAPHTGTVVHRQPVWTSAWYAGTRRPLP